MSAPLRTLESANKKPQTYMSVPIIRDAVNILDTSHHESDVERAITLILGHIFPQTEGWSNVPQYLVPEIKRPDRLVEKYTEPTGSIGSKQNFSPHIFVELKSAKGDSLKKALDQATSSMPQSVDNLGDTYSMHLIIVKGKYIAFFQYHNDRSNLYEDGVLNTKGAISFNHARYYASDPKSLTGRPHYTGLGLLEVDFEDGEKRTEVIEGVYLPLITEDVTIQRVLEWMKNNKPVDVDKTSTGTVDVTYRHFDSSPFPSGD